MTYVEAIGCMLIAFGPPFWIFVFFIARDPLRIILFVLGAFFWLSSLLISSLLWYTIIPLGRSMAFGLICSVAFQELFRFFYFFVLRRAQRGLDRLSAGGMHISGVHSLKHARHVLAVVCGLGMGVMSGMFLLVNVVADFSGRGTAGFPISLDDNVTVGHGDYRFCFMSSLSASMLVLSHVAWTVVFWNGCHRFYISRTWWIGVFLVVLSHYISTGISFFNQQHLYSITLSTQLALLLVNTWMAWSVMGGSLVHIKSLFGFGHSLNIQERPSMPDLEHRNSTHMVT